MLALHSDKPPDRRHLRAVEDALADLQQQAATFGFEGAGYLFSSRPPQFAGHLPRPSYLGNHSKVTDRSWLYAYLDQEMWRIDPVYQATLATNLPVWWSYDARPQLVLDVQGTTSAAQISMFEKCLRETGIRSGLSVPMHSNLSGAVGYIVFSARAPLDDLLPNQRQAEDSLLAMAHRFNHGIASHLPMGEPRPVKLSARELDCLSLASIGKTLEEAAIILSVSPSTVRFHLRSACRKLGVHNRMQAISKAAYLGLLGPIY